MLTSLRSDFRPRCDGKFLCLDGQRFWLKGATYGTFRSEHSNAGYPPDDVVARDFCLMAAHGFNTLRTYTPPPEALLDLALEHGLRVMVGLSWEQHVTFLGDRATTREIRRRLRDSVRQCAGHPAVLCYTVGNEVPAPIVRWHGKRNLEDFLRSLYDTAKGEDPEGLVTYVNFPSTEYLELPFLDLVCFNVYLERPIELAAYLRRLQHLAGHRPLILAEIGLDSQRHGEAQQAWSLASQIRTAITSGCAGALVFAWTDEWHRGGFDILDWDFGLTTRDRRPKPALDAVSSIFHDAPFAEGTEWPRISVVVCTYNGARTLRQCLTALEHVDYPDFEVIVVNDGSTDTSAVIAGEFQCRLITTPNRGLSSARNTGWQAAQGEIVAYIDDDAYPDPDWLRHLAVSFNTSSHAGIGGPNLGPPGDGFIAECVLNAPGGPVHVMLDDERAEHIPGCNMAFRREALEAIGGFDSQFRVAGDDVDLCWRIQERGWTIGFSPTALVWHHRRNSIKAYWKQQLGYGKAEALLERKWPEKYNSLGHIKWAGRIYGSGLARLLGRRSRIYHGCCGTAPFQSLQDAPVAPWRLLPAMPEWYLVIATLAGLAAMARVWPRLSLTVPMLLLALSSTVLQAFVSARLAAFPSQPTSPRVRLQLRVLTAFLHLVQPIARLIGRMRYGLTAWRWRLPTGFAMPRHLTLAFWSEHWHAPEERLRQIKMALRHTGAPTREGGEYDPWDLEVTGGLLGGVRLLMVVEEHGGGRQIFRFRMRPIWSPGLWLVLAGFAGLTGAAFADKAGIEVIALFALIPVLIASRTVLECGRATAVMRRTLFNQELKRVGYR